MGEKHKQSPQTLTSPKKWLISGCLGLYAETFSTQLHITSYYIEIQMKQVSICDLIYENKFITTTKPKWLTSSKHEYYSET